MENRGPYRDDPTAVRAAELEQLTAELEAKDRDLRERRLATAEGVRLNHGIGAPGRGGPISVQLHRLKLPVLVLIAVGVSFVLFCAITLVVLWWLLRGVMR
jgi:hypothetical protein